MAKHAFGSSKAKGKGKGAKKSNPFAKKGKGRGAKKGSKKR